MTTSAKVHRWSRATAAAFAAGWREQARKPGDVAGSAVFICLLVFVFGRLWTAVEAQRGLPRGWTVPTLLVYLVLAETVLFAPGAIHRRIASDVRSGDLAVQLLRPVGWSQFELARTAGQAAIAMLVLLAAGLSTTALLHGLPRLGWRGALLGAALLPLAVLFECAARLLIGVLAFWTEDSNAFFWIWHKLGFVLGGVLMPLELYPRWLQVTASALPFGAAIGGPARVVAGATEAIGHAALVLVLWTAAMVAALHLVHARASRVVQLNGG